MTDFLNLMLDTRSARRRRRHGAGGAHRLRADEQQRASRPTSRWPTTARSSKPPPQRPRSISAGPPGVGLRRHSTTNGNAAIGSSQRCTASDYGFAGGMDYHVSPDLGSASRSPAAAPIGVWRRISAAAAATLPGRRLWHDAFRPGLSVGRARLRQSLDHHQPHRAVGDQLHANFDGQSYAARVEAGYRYACCR